ncbi:MAG: argininosuccinate lyase [Anaerolineae bacterium]|nr:argininosuccinate lyase [Chloroflexota bacterium]MBV6435910.1 Argininosuccinate lyase [Anaerolineae bacterium]MCO6443860.1 argininosuccinate lyase [Anaerolineae bacterium]MDL1915167.1 argininosuccinate lyase [Anaerolineae bacterium CFX4]
MTLWGGAFSEPTDDDLRRLNDSLPFDQRMAAEDIRGSIAWANGLARAGVITRGEAETLVGGLNEIAREFTAGTFVFAEGDEDIHTAVERRLTELVGPVGGKLHTGRSRNDQVATDFRLWARGAAVDLLVAVRHLMRVLAERAGEHADTVMPGFTHLQPAQPITAGHWLMSVFWMLERDTQRLTDTISRIDVLPLGSGALAGVPFPIDRAALASELGFASISPNSLDAVSDRDFVAELLFGCALLGAHLSRLAEDVILFSNPAFGYVTLADRYSTGSSLMPQKRNADPMELTRGKAGRIIGDLTGLLTTLKGLPTGYNKDLQEDKEPLFDAIDTLGQLLPVVTGVVRTLTFHPDRMRAGLVAEMLATDLAEYLVRKGMPFREAHHTAGRAVRMARERGVPLDQLSLNDLRGLSGLIADDVAAVFDYDASVRSRSAPGGTAPESVRAQVAAGLALLAD